MKRIAAILLYCFACAIHFGHSIVPHNHHHEHSANEDRHKHDNESKSIFDLFAHFGQSGETFTSQAVQEINVSKSTAIAVDCTTFLREIDFSIADTSPPASFAESYIYTSPHLTSLHFRGPPSII